MGLYYELSPFLTNIFPSTNPDVPFLDVMDLDMQQGNSCLTEGRISV